jgi:hypothetical protein
VNNICRCIACNCFMIICIGLSPLARGLESSYVPLCQNTQSRFIHKNIDSHSFPVRESNPSFRIESTIRISNPRDPAPWSSRSRTGLHYVLHVLINLPTMQDSPKPSYNCLVCSGLYMQQSNCSRSVL